jgi:nitroreductase
MNIIQVIKNRRSIRRYKKNPVPLNLLKTIVESARWAPTGANKQYWKYIIVNDPIVMKMVKTVTPMMWDESPASIVVCQDLARRNLTEDMKQDFGECSGFPSQNILLTAYHLGLGSCAIGGFNKIALKEILDIPDDMWPMLIITVGYPDEDPEPKPRRPFSEVVFLNSVKNSLSDNDE